MFLAFIFIIFLDTPSISAQIASPNLDGKVFRIKTVPRGGKKMCLDVDSHSIGKTGSKVQMWACHDTYKNDYDQWFANQFWKFEKVGSNTYRIKSLTKNSKSIVYLDAEAKDQGQNGRKIHL